MDSKRFSLKVTLTLGRSREPHGADPVTAVGEDAAPGSLGGGARSSLTVFLIAPQRGPGLLWEVTGGARSERQLHGGLSSAPVTVLRLTSARLCAGPVVCHTAEASGSLWGAPEAPSPQAAAL